MGVDFISSVVGRQKYCWAGRIDALKVSSACSEARKLEARPRVGVSLFGVSVESRDHVMVQEAGVARGEDDIEYCRGWITGSIPASLVGVIGMEV